MAWRDDVMQSHLDGVGCVHEALLLLLGGEGLNEVGGVVGALIQQARDDVAEVIIHVQPRLVARLEQEGLGVQKLVVGHDCAGTKKINSLI
jgi:hypothetical protein